MPSMMYQFVVKFSSRIRIKIRSSFTRGSAGEDRSVHETRRAVMAKSGIAAAADETSSA
jgi:hypothetical protein